MYPRIQFKTEIHADELVDEIGELDPSERTGMLFSGGADSTLKMVYGKLGISIRENPYRRSNAHG